MISQVTTQIEDELSLALVSSDEGFRALSEDWRSLYLVAGRSPFNSWEWLFSWWQIYRPGKLRILVWRRASDKDMIGILPLYLQTERAGGLKCNVLRFIGDGTFDSDYLDFVGEDKILMQGVGKLSEWLMSSTEWDVLVLREIPRKSKLPEIIENICTRLQLNFRFEYGRCGIVDVPSSFDQFLTARRPRFRTKVRSLLRAFEQDQSLVFEDTCAPKELRSRLRSLFALHQERWQNNGLPGVFGAKAKRLFYGRFVPRFARNGWLRLYSLRKEDRYVAHQLCFADKKTTHLLQEGFDISNPSASYGQMLRALVFRDLIQRGEEKYDFLGGFSNHKADWGATEARTVHAIIGRRNLRGSVYFKYPLWREGISIAVKQYLPESVFTLLRR